MKLEIIVITGFRSIKDTERIRLDDKLTILIGANDHGKSNILEAIRSLNGGPFKKDDRNWDLPDDKEVRIEWHFKLDDGESLTDRIEQMKAEEEKEETEEGEGAEEDVEEAVPAENVQNPDNTESDKNNEEGKEPEEKQAEEKQVSYYTKNNEGKLIFYREGLKKAVKILSVPVEGISEADEEYLLELRPRVELFEAPKSNLVDRVNKEQLETEEFEFMQGMFRLAGLWEHKDIMFSDNEKTSKLLDEASERLTKVLNEKWNQGKDLVWKLKHTGTNGDHIEIRIQDPSISSRYTRPSLRSSGFRTYFLTSMIISARTANYESHSYIYLFDEPGIYLHPHAQLDLQRAYEKISDDAQIVYTTHSLFLINKNYPERNIVVSKTSEGTKVNQKPYLNNWKSVRESLGILFSNNFLIADKTLIVEGFSDISYILDSIRRLKKSGDVEIDLNDFSVVDAGDERNYVAMTKLMLSEGREIVALVDGDSSGEKIKGELEKVCEKEFKEKRLSIFPLDQNKSTEDYCADTKTIREAIQVVVNDLVGAGVRTLKTSITLDDELKKIRKTKGKTLGNIIDELTSSLFQPEEKVSKVSIALKYEDLSRERQLAVSSEAQDLIKQIAKLLALKGEKSAEKGVFEETK